jgi:putative oxidoreductase
METVLGKFSPQIYALLRIVGGLLFAQHGAQKILGAFGGVPPEVPAFIKYGAGSIELVGGLLIAVGLFAGLVAFISSGEMAVAYFMAHAGKGLFPIQNGGELAVLYCFLFLYIAARGSGAWSVDAAMRGKR